MPGQTKKKEMSAVIAELEKFINEPVTVFIQGGIEYKGIFRLFTSDDYSVILEDATMIFKDDSNMSERKFKQVLIKGNRIEFISH